MTNPQAERPQRADAARNRAKVLEVATAVFAAEGLSVPVHEIARRAGVGTGTVSRHFPTKEDLFAAILLEQMAALVHAADERAGLADPGAEFFAMFAAIVHAGASHRGLAEALSGSGCDVDELGRKAGFDVSGRLSELLTRAQQAGAVRTSVDYLDVKALLAGCMARDSPDLDPLLDVITRGLRA